MPKPRKSERAPQPPPPDSPEPENVQTDVLPEESGNGHAEQVEQTEQPDVELADPPAKVKYSAEGSPRAVQAAARKIANSPLPVVATPIADTSPPDETDALLADGRNMVIVQRQFPKSVEMADGSRRRSAVKLPERYACPTTREEIEHDVFDNHGGKKYKCTIHPATTNGEQSMLAFFTIECDLDPIFDDAMTAVQQAEQQDVRTSLATNGGDSTMHETDGMAKTKALLERRIERLNQQAEIDELQDTIRKMEKKDDRKPDVPVIESDEMKKLREENAKLAAALAEKKVNDQFDQIRATLTTLTASITALSTKPAEKTGESDTMKFILKKMDTDSAQISELTKALTTVKATPTASSGADDLDKFLSRAEKLKAITSSGDKGGGRLSEVENRLIDIAWEKLNGGEGGGGDGGETEDDIGKLAIKEFAPILKDFVDKKMSQETKVNGAPPSPDREQQIREEAAKFAVAKIAESLHAQGIALTTGPDGKLLALTGQPKGKVTVPPRHAGTKVVSSKQTPGGLVKKISIQPTDLMNKTQPEPQPEAEAPAEGGEVKHGVFPKLGDGGATLKILFPIHPGEMQYDRKKSVDFVLAGIRSEIRQGFPQKVAAEQPVESYFSSDAIEFLDEELLNRLEAIDSGPQLEALLMESGGDRAQIDEIKKAGEDEIVASFLRRLIKTLQTDWTKEKVKRGK